MSTGILEFLENRSESGWIDRITDFLKDNCIEYTIVSDHIKFKFFFIFFNIYYDNKNYIVEMEKESFIPHEISNFLFGMYHNKNKTDFKISSSNNLLIFVSNMIKILRLINNVHSRRN